MGGGKNLQAAYRLMVPFLHKLLVWNDVVPLMEGVKQQKLVPLRAAAHQRPRL